ncbi:MAG: hypothetical protein AB7O88_17145 [Reyranellaceae bacterium]
MSISVPPLPTATPPALTAHDPRDPDPWLALALDQSLPVDPEARRALVHTQSSWSRRWMFPIVRTLARVALVANHALRAVLPSSWSSSRLLHRAIVWGLRRFVSPAANHLILRHFHVGSEILAFIAANVPGFTPQTVPLRPRRLDDLLPHAFVQHDINLYNFIIGLNAHLQQDCHPERSEGSSGGPGSLAALGMTEGSTLRPPARVDFSPITDGPFDIEPLPVGRLNRVDLQSAIEAYTPVYQLFLSARDFRRATDSLQLDETIALYVGTILGSTANLAFVANRHPLVPESTLDAARRLVLHGLAAEQLHYHLRLLKRRQGNADKFAADRDIVPA